MAHRQSYHHYGGGHGIIGDQQPLSQPQQQRYVTALTNHASSNNAAVGGFMSQFQRRDMTMVDDTHPHHAYQDTEDEQRPHDERDYNENYNEEEDEDDASASDDNNTSSDDEDGDLSDGVEDPSSPHVAAAAAAARSFYAKDTANKSPSPASRKRRRTTGTAGSSTSPLLPGEHHTHDSTDGTRGLPSNNNASLARQEYDRVSTRALLMKQRLAGLEKQTEAVRKENEEANKDFLETTDRLLDELVKEENNDWNLWYQRLVSFYKKRGNSMVRRVNSQEDLAEEPNLDKLGMWVYHQRVAYRKGRDEPSDKYPPLEYFKIKALEKLDFTWEVKHEKWLQRFNELKAFKTKYGDCETPHPNKAERNGDPIDPELCRWCNYQRSQYNRFQQGLTPVMLDQARIDMLLDLGLRLGNKYDILWERCFEDAKEFHEMYGHWACGLFDDQYSGLESWINEQCTQYNKKTLSKERYQKLTAIGFRFSKKRTTEEREIVNWWKGYEALKAYKYLFGTSEVPYIPDARKYPGGHLPLLEKQQRKLYMWSRDERRDVEKFYNRDPTTNMTPERLKLLKDIDFSLDEPERPKFPFTTPQTRSIGTSTDDTPPGVQPPVFAVSARPKYTKKEQYELAKWHETYEALRSFCYLYGHCFVPDTSTGTNTNREHKKDDPHRLFHWCRVQRTYYLAKKENSRHTPTWFTDELIQMLDELEFMWNPADFQKALNEQQKAYADRLRPPATTFATPPSWYEETRAKGITAPTPPVVDLTTTKTVMGSSAAAAATRATKSAASTSKSAVRAWTTRKRVQSPKKGGAKSSKTTATSTATATATEDADTTIAPTWTGTKPPPASYTDLSSWKSNVIQAQANFTSKLLQTRPTNTPRETAIITENFMSTSTPTSDERGPNDNDIQSATTSSPLLRREALL
jgi:hypothetical protein